MLNANVAGFAAIAVVIVMTPGPDMLLIARHTLASGRRTGLACAVGVLAGVFVHAFAAAVGLSAILASSARAFAVVKVAGAAYLIFIGLSGLVAALRARGDFSKPDSTPPARGLPSVFRHGLITNVLNPKVAILFLSILPQFVDTNSTVLPQTLVLSALFIAIAILWLGFYVGVLATVGAQILTDKLRRWIEGVAGTVLVLLGIRLLFDDG